MHPEVLAHLQAALRVLLTVLAFHALPVVVAMSGAPTCRARDRAVAVGGYAVLALLALQFSDFAANGLVCAYGYLCVIALVPCALAKVSRRRGVLFAVALALFMIVPAAFESRSRTIALVVGWDLMLSAYSYCATKQEPFDLADYMFFLFVNPALVYTQRGSVVGGVGLHGRALARAAGGAAAVLASGMVPLLGLALGASRGSASLHAALGLEALVRFYLANTGLASIQIGLCRQLGIALPERYVRPICASSPKDFWRRWNTYVGAWARIYIFQPLTLYASRRIRWRGWPLVMAVVTFLCVGLLHDLYTTLAWREVRWSATAWFAVNGVIVVLWEMGARVVKRRAAGGLLRELATRALVFALAIVMAAGMR
jgi:hypothetical protein